MELIRVLSKIVTNIADLLTERYREECRIFKIEQHLTFLNIHRLERQGADIQTKVEELEELNQSLRQRDKMKDDAIAQLSDQLVSLSANFDFLEKSGSVSRTH